ncbi:hypothetical protein [Duganella levis]|uniref:Uncharacterized protein n=1 Tax=Duganella levis TaxID=2692169 RepID=A0ABW9W0K8_9BURK|nr:hypothetical protein [Duganella levis]MYN27519.1 hypothetical protein [Duganella levis]
MSGNGDLKNWGRVQLKEMRAALPFTKFTVATSLGGEVGMLLMMVFSVEAHVAIAVAMVIAAAAGWVWRNPKKSL